MKGEKQNNPLRTINYRLQTSRGFTLLYAALISSLLLSIGLAIFNITIKELVLSQGARESVFAFYAADTGVECALYHDFQTNSFSTSSPALSVACGGSPLREIKVDESVPGVYVRTFSIDFSPEPYCVEVEVTKFDSPPRTELRSRGFNTCTVGQPRRVQRALLVTY